MAAQTRRGGAPELAPPPDGDAERAADEIVILQDLRSYLQAFAGAAYQNPKSICPRHHMLLPRSIKG